MAPKSPARISKFVLPSVVEHLGRGGGGPMELLCFTVASWFRYLTGTDDRGNPLPINDPMAEKLQERARTDGRDAGPLLGVREVFTAQDLASSPAFAGHVGEMA